jgi:hypothetical protein
MTPAEGDAPAQVESLVGEARRAVRRAVEAEGRTRQGAFDLLAADGFATWACEAAIDGPDPEGALVGVLDALLE